MPKLNLLKIGLSLILIIFSLCFGCPSIAGDCDENRSTPQDIQTATGEFNIAPGWRCTGDPGIEYDTANSAGAINQNSSGTVSVIGNNAPFTWTIGGTGFWLDAAHTKTTIVASNNSVVIYADASACGSCAITVTDCDDTETTGYVRCTSGTWVSCDPAFIIPENDTRHPYGCSGDFWSYLDGFKYYRNGKIRSSIVDPGVLVQNCSTGGDAITTCGIHGDVLLSDIYGFTPPLNIGGKAAGVSYWGCQ